MGNLFDSLPFMSRKNTIKVDSYIPEPNEYISEDCSSIICRNCGEVRRVKKYSPLFKAYIWTKADPDSYCMCSCEMKMIAERIEAEDKENFKSLYDCEELRTLVGLKYIDRTFSNTIKTVSRTYNAAYEACVMLCKDKDDTIQKGKGIYIWSKGPGTGKSTLLACVRNSFVSEYKPCVFINSSDLIGYASYRNDDDGKKFNFAMFSRVPVLIVDDIGAQSLDRNSNYCGWANDVWYSLIEKRNRNNLSTMFSSNYSPNGLKDRGYDFKTVDRISERCAGNVYEIEGSSFRGI